MRQARDKLLFQQSDIHPCIYKRFCDDLVLEQPGDDFLVCGLSSDWECLEKAEIVSLRPEHQKEIHFLKRRISVNDFGVAC